jgi:hypothetical protein
VATFRTDRTAVSLADLLPAPVVPETVDEPPIEEAQPVSA